MWARSSRVARRALGAPRLRRGLGDDRGPAPARRRCCSRSSCASPRTSSSRAIAEIIEEAEDERRPLWRRLRRATALSASRSGIASGWSSSRLADVLLGAAALDVASALRRRHRARDPRHRDARRRARRRRAAGAPRPTSPSRRPGSPSAMMLSRPSSTSASRSSGGIVASPRFRRAQPRDRRRPTPRSAPHARPRAARRARARASSPRPPATTRAASRRTRSPARATATRRCG